MKRKGKNRKGYCCYYDCMMIEVEWWEEEKRREGENRGREGVS